MPTPTIHDPRSKAYKKAKRQHLKSTRGRNDQVEADWTPFRAAEKKYKAKFPPPDLSDVLDLALLDATREEEVKAGVWKGSVDVVDFEEIELMVDDDDRRPDGKKRRAYVCSRIPGIVVLPSFLGPAAQRSLVRWSLRDHARHPNETNLDTHYVLPEEGLWNVYQRRGSGADGVEDVQPRCSTTSTPFTQLGPRQLISNEPASKDNYLQLAAAPAAPALPSPNARPCSPAALIPKLRWANIGWYYHWGNKQYDFTRGKIPVSKVYSDVCKEAVRAVPWGDVFQTDTEDDWGDEPKWDDWAETYEPDAGIVNFYQTKDTLMAHVDRSEICATSPLVSISLGCAAILLIGGTSREVEPVPILLRSGDIVIMSGPKCRRAFHGVPRILEGSLPPQFSASGEPDWSLYEEYLRTARININVRQVFPKGFDPQLPPSNAELHV